jgi:hypothetical protein
VPDQVNHVELRLFLRDILQNFGILAYDIFKKQGNNWAILTVANPANGREFIKCYGHRARQILLFKGIALNCRISNRKGQPEALKVISLIQKEEDMKAKKANRSYVPQPTGSVQSTFPFQSLMTGVWDYDHHDKLIFNKKFKDLRQGCVTFGKSAFVIYLRNTTYHEYDWHGRIDIPFGILEHAIPSVDNGTRGSITFTLKSPPKIYRIQGTDDLHLYTGEQATTPPNRLPNLANLSLGVSLQNRRAPRLERLCTLQRRHDKNSALCMVYKLSFSNIPLVYKAWTFLQDFSVPAVHCWKTTVPHTLTQTVEIDFDKLELALSYTRLDFAEKFQLVALVLEGTITPVKAKELIPFISSLSGTYGAKLTSLAVQKLGQQIPTPGPHVDSEDFQIATIQQTLEANVRDTQSTEMTYNTLHGTRKPQEHLALTYKATVTPTGKSSCVADSFHTTAILKRFAEASAVAQSTTDVPRSIQSP